MSWIFDIPTTTPVAPGGSSGDIQFNNGGTFGGEALVPLAHGGTAADLSGTGGAHFVLRQSTVGGAITVSQLAYSDISGTIPTPPSGSVLWSALGNAAADLTLANAGFKTTFNQTSAVNWTWANTTAATSTLFVVPNSFATNPTSGTRNDHLSVGFAFTVSTTITVNSLGRKYLVGNTGNHEVILWSPTSTILASGNVLAASASDADGFKWVAVTPVVLTPGNTYYIGVTEFSGDNWYSRYSPNLQSIFTSVFAGYSNNADDIPSNNGGSGAFSAPAMAYTYSGNITNQSSPLLDLSGTYYNGSASAADTWSVQDVISNTLNGTSTLTFAHTGSSGVAAVSIPLFTNLPVVSAGVLSWNADAGISRLGAGSLAIGNGTAGDYSGSLKLAGISLVGAGNSPSDGGLFITTTGVTQQGSLQVINSGTQLEFGINHAYYTAHGGLYRQNTSWGGAFLQLIGYSDNPSSIIQGSLVSIAGAEIPAFGFALLSGGHAVTYNLANLNIPLLWDNGSGTADTGISRLGAASLAVGNGTAGNASGKLTLANLKITGLSVYASNALAITGGLAAGDLYRTGADPDVVCVVH